MASKTQSILPTPPENPTDRHVTSTPYHESWMKSFREWCDCTHCQTGGLIHPVYVKVLQTFLQTTGRPALVAQAFITMIYQPLYYNQLQTFDISTDAEMISWVKVSMPVRWVGFIVVSVLAVAHTLVVLGVLIAFMMSTKYLKLKDPWSIFAYASNGELADIIEEAKRLNAENCVEHIKEQGVENEVVGLGPDDNQNIGIRKRIQGAQQSDVEDLE